MYVNSCTCVCMFRCSSVYLFMFMLQMRRITFYCGLFIILEVRHWSPTHTYVCMWVFMSLCVSVPRCLCFTSFIQLFIQVFLFDTHTRSLRRWVYVCLLFLICFLVGVKTVFCFFLYCFDAFDLLKKPRNYCMLKMICTWELSHVSMCVAIRKTTSIC